MKKNPSRREVIKNLGLAGFSLYLTSCWTDISEETIKDKKLPVNGDSLSNNIPKDSIEIIEEVLKSKNVAYFKKGDEAYNSLKVGFNLRVPKTPALIALCENERGVAEAVRYAKQNDLKISIKSGGHSFESFSSNDGGMQINLSLLKQISWQDNNTVKIGPGLLLKELYAQLLPKKRIIPAGSCGTVGVGGLALGGGYGFFARKHGLTCDSVLEARMVDGKGEIHNIKNNSDLMWALRGGGNGNFGVFTEFTFRTYTAPDHFTRHRFKAFKLDTFRSRELLKTWFQYSSKLPKSAFSAFVLNGKTLTILLTHYEDRTEGIDKMIKALENVCDKTSKGEPRNLEKSLKTYYGIQHPIYFKNASAGYYKDFEHIEGCIDEVLEKVISSRGLIYQVNTLGGNIAQDDFKEGSCYPHRDWPYLSELQSYWEEGQDSSKLLRAFKEVQNIFYDHGIRTQYRNYPDIDFKDWETAYYGKTNYARLQQIKHLYDPEDRIQHPQSIKI